MRAALGVIAAAVVFVSGCAVQKDWIDRTLVTVDVTGVWEGTFTGTNGSGGVRFVLQQQGAKIKGEMKIYRLPVGPPERAIAEGPIRIEGTVSGDAFTFQMVDTQIVKGPQGYGEFQVNGDEMIGSFSRFYNQTATLHRQQ